MTTDRDSSSIILWSVCGYFFLCGASALLYPASWLIVSGLPSTVSNELDVLFGTVGAFLLALSYGGARAALSPTSNVGVIAVLLVANLLDFVVTLRAVVAGKLPMFNGGLFLIVAIAWATVLVPVYLRARRTSTTPVESLPLE